MATLEEKLCPVCFQEAMEGGKCQNCGYVLDKTSVGENHLKPFSILNTKYLLGKKSRTGRLWHYLSGEEYVEWITLLYQRVFSV